MYTVKRKEQWKGKKKTGRTKRRKEGRAKSRKDGRKGEKNVHQFIWREGHMLCFKRSERQWEFQSPSNPFHDISNGASTNHVQGILLLWWLEAHTDVER